MENKDILYKDIIYRDAKRLEIYKKDNLIIDKYCKTDSEIYQTIISKTLGCKDINQIEIIYK